MVTKKIVRIDITSIEPEEGAPAPERLLSGDPKFRTWNVEEADGGVYAGIWEAYARDVAN